MALSYTVRNVYSLMGTTLELFASTFQTEDGDIIRAVGGEVGTATVTRRAGGPVGDWYRDCAGLLLYSKPGSYGNRHYATPLDAEALEVAGTLCPKVLDETVRTRVMDVAVSFVARLLDKRVDELTASDQTAAKGVAHHRGWKLAAVIDDAFVIQRFFSSRDCADRLRRIADVALVHHHEKSDTMRQIVRRVMDPTASDTLTF